jgi:hypothetical protein
MTAGDWEPLFTAQLGARRLWRFVGLSLNLNTIRSSQDSRLPFSAPKFL